jgi:hypothetical protein
MPACTRIHPSRPTAPTGSGSSTADSGLRSSRAPRSSRGARLDAGSRNRSSSECCAGIRATCPSASGLRSVRGRAGGLDRDRDISGNSAACVKREGADFQERRTCVWVPPVGPSCVHEPRSVGRVPRSTQHAGVGGVERRATIDERHDVVQREVTRRMGRMLGTVARAYVSVLADVAGDHPLGQASLSRVRMDVVVGTDARQPGVLAAPTH